jgi:hypothetical protein
MTEERVSKIGCALVWGSMGMGKTRFALNSPYKPILHIDMHGSARHYFADRKRLGLDFTWQLCLTPDKIKAAVETTKKQHWGTIVLDTVEEFCGPLVVHFQRIHANKMEKLSELVWGDINNAITARLTELMSHCDMLVMTADLRNFRGEDQPRAKPAAVRLTDVVLRLVREPNQAIPYALVSRTRLQGLPPRIPQATWPSIFEYLKNPVDWANLKPEEMAPEVLFADLEEAA